MGFGVTYRDFGVTYWDLGPTIGIFAVGLGFGSNYRDFRCGAGIRVPPGVSGPLGSTHKQRGPSAVTLQSPAPQSMAPGKPGLQSVMQRKLLFTRYGR